MGNKMIGKAVNQFIQIAGMWALVWGALGGLISVRSQSCLVVLCGLFTVYPFCFHFCFCGRASDCVAVVPYVDKLFLWIK